MWTSNAVASVVTKRQGCTLPNLWHRSASSLRVATSSNHSNNTFNHRMTSTSPQPLWNARSMSVSVSKSPFSSGNSLSKSITTPTLLDIGTASDGHWSSHGTYHQRQQRRHFAKRKGSKRRRRSNVLKEKELQQKRQSKAEMGGALNEKGEKVEAQPPQAPKSWSRQQNQRSFSMPNQDKERQLASVQDKVQDAYRSGSYKTGLKHAESYLKICLSHFEIQGESQKNKHNHPAIASAYSDVGLFHKLLGNFEQSRTHYKTAVHIYKRTVGVDHASHASLLHNLGNLNRTQVHFDEELRPADRVSLMEEAADCLELAYKIRRDERGPQHPHTVASRSSWGATLAAQILHNYKLSTRTPTSTRSYGGGGGKPATTTQQFYVPIQPISPEKWALAEQHLRVALETGIETPRGPGLHQKQHQHLSTPSLPEISTASENGNSAETENYQQIQTLSAASAGQNLAIFLKTRGTTLLPVLNTRSDDDSEQEAEWNEKLEQASSGSVESKTKEDVEKTSDSEKEEQKDPPTEAKVVQAAQEVIPEDTRSEEKKERDRKIRLAKDAEDEKAREQANVLFEEALVLYKRILQVRMALLPKGHADLYATQHSLAELLHAMGKKEEAEAMQQLIIDTYEDKEGKNKNENVVIETTSSSTNDSPPESNASTTATATTTSEEKSQPSAEEKQ